MTTNCKVAVLTYFFEICCSNLRCLKLSEVLETLVMDLWIVMRQMIHQDSVPRGSTSFNGTALQKSRKFSGEPKIRDMK
jgi:hypothetical protein